MAQRANRNQMPIVMKSNKNETTINLGNGTSDFTNQSVTITVTGHAAVAMVTLSIAVFSSSDFEFGVYLLVNGVQNAIAFTPTASMGNGRSHTRVLTGVLTLPVGTNVIVPRIGISSATSPLVNSNGLNITVLALGNVS